MESASYWASHGSGHVLELEWDASNVTGLTSLFTSSAHAAASSPESADHCHISSKPPAILNAPALATVYVCKHTNDVQDQSASSCVAHRPFQAYAVVISLRHSSRRYDHKWLVFSPAVRVREPQVIHIACMMSGDFCASHSKSVLCHQQCTYETSHLGSSGGVAPYPSV